MAGAQQTGNRVSVPAGCGAAWRDGKARGRPSMAALRQERVTNDSSITAHARCAQLDDKIGAIPSGSPGVITSFAGSALLVVTQNLNVALARCSCIESPLLHNLRFHQHTISAIFAPHRFCLPYAYPAIRSDASEKRCTGALIWPLCSRYSASRNAGMNIWRSPTQITAWLAGGS